MDLTLSNLRSDYKLIHKIHPITAMRISILIEFVKIENQCRYPDLKKAKRIKILALCRGIDISLRTLYRWRAAYIKGGFVALTKRKAPGKKALELTDVEKFLIREMREKYRWGSEVIQAHLLRDHSVKLSKYRIERYLKFSGLREEFPCTTKKVRRRVKIEHRRVVKIYNPGEHTQIDTKHLPKLLQNGKKSYVLNFIDHASNWSYKRAYSSPSPKNTVDFMKRVLEKCPFKIKRIQSDNGTEFTYKYYKRYADLEKKHPFEEYCKRKGIVHKLIPPGMKELQGLVERSHRQDDQELFSRIEPVEIEEFNRHIQEYSLERNRHRRFKKLDWRTPDEWLEAYVVLGLVVRYKRLLLSNDFVTRVKFDEVTKSTEQLPKVKFEKNVNNCNDKKKNVDKIDIKKAS